MEFKDENWWVGLEDAQKEQAVFNINHISTPPK